MGRMQLLKCIVERRDRIVKKAEKRFLIYMIEMVVFCAIMIFGIFFGHRYPQIFFWGIIVVFATVVTIEIAPTWKDTMLLVIGMIVLAVVITAIDKLVDQFLGEHRIIGFIVSCVLLAPFYFPLFNHFCNMCKKAAIRMKQELTEKSK